MRFLFYILIMFVAATICDGQVEVLDNFHPYRNQTSFTQKLNKKTDTGNNYDLVYHRMHLNLDTRVDSMRGSITSYFKPLNNGFSQIQFDLVDEMTVDSILQRGEVLSFAHANNVIDITLKNSISAGQLDSLTIFYHGTPTNNSQNSYGREKGRPQDDHPLIWTLSEPYGASSWWPCKQGLSDKIDSMDQFFTIAKGEKAAGNGLLISQTALNDSQLVVHWKHRYPIVTYLVAVAVTNYDEFTDMVYFKNGDSLPILNYIFPEYMSSGRGPARETVRIMLLFDSLFGTYPFMLEKYGHAQFLRGGGMEHQTMSFMVDWNFGLVAHELAHQWFGNQVTCGSWSDLWLNEGFATYATLLSYHALLGRNAWIANNNHSRNRAMELTSGSVYVRDTLNVGRLFSSRLTYHKGAQVLHMLRWLIGDSAFYSGLRNYLNDANLTYGFAINGDLQRHLESTSGRSLQDFFDDWVFGESYPEFTVMWHLEGQQVVVRLKQQSSVAGIDHYVAPVELMLRSGQDSAYYRLETNSNDSTFRFDIGFKPDSLFFDPNYWILAKASVFKEDDVAGDIKLFPNPAATQIEVRYGVRVLKSLRVYNLTGQLVFEELVAPGLNSHQLRVDHLVPGLYILQAFGEGESAAARFIKR